jgi:hypothetical protein
LRAWWREYLAVFRYVRDPHGYERRYRLLAQRKYLPKPGMFLMNGSIVVHPALAAQLQRDMGMIATKEGRLADAPLRLAGMDVYVSVNALEQPPEGGWPDVAVPERPRWRP